MEGEGGFSVSGEAPRCGLNQLAEACASVSNGIDAIKCQGRSNQAEEEERGRCVESDDP